jgi:predicted glutamine amidotransferase
MCVIICRDPGIEIPHDMLESAAVVNPDGYGISVIDRGKLETIKEASVNKAKTIIKRLEDAKEQRVFLHLRFKTHGEINTDNCHPFDVYTDNENTIQMMHNGVLSDFSTGYNAKMSDTYHFNDQILKPLVKKLLPYHNVENSSVLDDDTLKMVIEKYCGFGSKIVLYDNHENFMIANRKAGVEHKGWWASNDYSFNQNHRTPSKTTYYGGYKYNEGRSSGVYSFDDKDDDLPWTSDPNYKPPTIAKAAKEAAQTTSKSNAVGKKSVGPASVVSISQQTAKHVNPTIVPPQMRDTFIELVGVNRLDQLTVMEQEDIAEIVNEYPEAAVILIMDLFYELYMKNKEPKEPSIGKI